MEELLEQHKIQILEIQIPTYFLLVLTPLQVMIIGDN